VGFSSALFAATVIVTYVPVVVPPATTGDYSNIHTVAVVSAIGDKLEVSTAGFWTSKSKQLDIADWNIDQQVENELKQRLGSRFTFKHVDYPRAQIAALDNDLSTIGHRDLDKLLATIPNDGIDAFIVVRPDLEGDMWGTPGLAWGRSSKDDPLPTSAANYEIDIVDSHTFKQIGHAASRLQLRASSPVSFPGVRGGLTVQLDESMTPTPTERLKMRLVFSDLVSKTLVATLRSLNLGVPLPNPGERELEPVPDAERLFPNLKSVGIVSAVGGNLALYHVGTLLSHDDSAQPVAEWNLDTEIEDMVRGALDKRIAVKPVQADRAVLAALDLPITQDSIGKEMPGLPANSDVDAFLVILKHTGPISTLPEVSGVGIWNRTALMGDYTVVFANYTLALVNARTLKPMRLRIGAVGPMWKTAGPFEQVDDKTFPEKKAPLTPEQATTAHNAIKEIMAESVSETLLRMGLTGMMVKLPPLASTPTASPASGTMPLPVPVAPPPAPQPPPAH